ncbi:MAG: hypothetical protein WCF85_01015 [Rhodospirillaceae bacterium]
MPGRIAIDAALPGCENGLGLIRNSGFPAKAEAESMTMSEPTFDHDSTGYATLPAEDEFDLRCTWAGRAGHPHLSIGYAVLDDETVWGVYVCSATNVTSGNEWSFTLPMTFNIHEVTNIALNVIAWDRFMVIAGERPDFDEKTKQFIAASLRIVEQLSRPCRLVTAIQDSLSS